MTVTQLIDTLQLEILNAGDLSRTVTGGYCGDLLSHVMGKATVDNVWFSVMGNVNAIAVCVLTEVACLVLTDNAPLDEAAKFRAQAENVTVLRSTRSTYDLAAELGRLSV